MERTQIAPARFSAEFAGCSDWARQIQSDVLTVAVHSATVLITGPSGTGKELIARAIHTASQRAQQPFVPVDCAAASGTLFASQMFGHERGAFTGATHESLGAFRAADGGTIFLDELGELELDLQAKLLRTLQERVVMPVGGTRQIPIDVRVIAATNCDLRERVRSGKFRTDLYFRLNAVTLTTTPLASRTEDIPPLIEFLLSRMEVRHGLPRKRISPAAMSALIAYDWPGNIRELENVLERATLFCHSEEILPEHLPEPLHVSLALHSVQSADGPFGFHEPMATWANSTANRLNESSRPTWPTLEEWIRCHLVATLRRTNFNQSEASQLLGIERNALRRMARRLHIDLSHSRPGRPPK